MKSKVSRIHKSAQWAWVARAGDGRGACFLSLGFCWGSGLVFCLWGFFLLIPFWWRALLDSGTARFGIAVFSLVPWFRCCNFRGPLPEGCESILSFSCTPSYRVHLFGSRCELIYREVLERHVPMSTQWYSRTSGSTPVVVVSLGTQAVRILSTYRAPIRRTVPYRWPS